MLVVATPRKQSVDAFPRSIASEWPATQVVSVVRGFRHSGQGCIVHNFFDIITITGRSPAEHASASHLPKTLRCYHQKIKNCQTKHGVVYLPQDGGRGLRSHSACSQPQPSTCSRGVSLDCRSGKTRRLKGRAPRLLSVVPHRSVDGVRSGLFSATGALNPGSEESGEGGRLRCTHPNCLISARR